MSKTIDAGAQSDAGAFRMKPPAGSATRVERGLGAFSVGLGGALIAVPGLLAKLSGMPDDPASRIALRSAGVREVLVGIGLLTTKQPSGWVWARAGQDAMDISMIGLATMRPNVRSRKRLLITGGVLAGICAVDVLAASRSTRRAESALVDSAGDDAVSNDAVEKAMATSQAKASVMVDRPVKYVFDAWHNFSAFPRFMEHVESVSSNPDGTLHWVVKAPAGMSVDWDARIVADVPNQRIEWESEPDSMVRNHGCVEFRKGENKGETEVTVDLQFHPPMGAAGKAVARLFGEHPQQQIEEDLMRFKQVLESGGIDWTEAPTVKPDMVDVTDEQAKTETVVPADS